MAEQEHIPPPEPKPHVPRGVDPMTELRIRMEYMVNELSRQGQILGNGDGLISVVRELKQWKESRSRVEWIILTVLLGAAVLWFVKALLFLATKM